MGKLTADDEKFLRCLRPDGSPTGGWFLPPASREQDRARTKAKKQGWAAFDRKAWAWMLLPAGREALKEQAK